MSAVPCPKCQVEWFPNQHCNNCGTFIPIPEPPAPPGPAPDPVAKLLKDVGLEEHLPAFQAQEINGEVLPTLSDSDLKELGVELLVHRRRILAALPKPPQPAAAAEAAVLRPRSGSASDDWADDPATNALMSVEGGAAAAIILGFFLPWIGLGFMGDISGWEMLKTGWEAEEVALFVPAASPLTAALVLAVLAMGDRVRLSGIAAGLTPWLMLGYVAFKFSDGGVALDDVFEIIVKGTSYGLWLALAGGGVLLVRSIKELNS